MNGHEVRPPTLEGSIEEAPFMEPVTRTAESKPKPGRPSKRIHIAVTDGALKRGIDVGNGDVSDRKARIFMLFQRVSGVLKRFRRGFDQISSPFGLIQSELPSEGRELQGLWCRREVGLELLQALWFRHQGPEESSNLALTCFNALFMHR